MIIINGEKELVFTITDEQWRWMMACTLRRPPSGPLRLSGVAPDPTSPP